MKSERWKLPLSELFMKKKGSEKHFSSPFSLTRSNIESFQWISACCWLMRSGIFSSITAQISEWSAYRKQMFELANFYFHRNWGNEREKHKIHHLYDSIDSCIIRGKNKLKPERCFKLEQFILSFLFISISFFANPCRIWWRTTSMVHHGNIWSANKYVASQYFIKISRVHCWWTRFRQIAEDHYLCYQCKRSKWFGAFGSVHIEGSWKTNT